MSQGDVVRGGHDSRAVHTMAPLFQGGEQGKKFALVSWVVSLDRVKLFGHAGNELHASVLISLVQGCTKSKLACVQEDVVVFLWVWETQCG